MAKTQHREHRDKSTENAEKSDLSGRLFDYAQGRQLIVDSRKRRKRRNTKNTEAGAQRTRRNEKRRLEAGATK